MLAASFVLNSMHFVPRSGKFDLLHNVNQSYEDP